MLNDWVDKIYPDLDIADIVMKHEEEEKERKKLKVQTTTEEVEKPSSDDTSRQHVRMDKEIEDEIKKMKKHRIFFVFETGTSGVIFIKLLDCMRPFIDINRLGTAIINHIVENKDA